MEEDEDDEDGYDNDNEEEGEDDDDRTSLGSYDASSDEDDEYDEDNEDEDPEAILLEGLALSYTVKHWLSHASKATTEIAEALSLEEDFWKTDSIIRRRWLTEHTRLDGAFKTFDRQDIKGLHVAGAIGFRQLVVALMKNGHQDEINQRDGWDNTPVSNISHREQAQPWFR